jgi:hypothetical protein
MARIGTNKNHICFWYLYFIRVIRNAQVPLRSTRGYHSAAVPQLGM